VSARLSAALGPVARVRGVRAALIASERDGVAVKTIAQIGVATDALAAFATSLHRRTRMASTAAGYGAVRFIALEAEKARLCAAAQDDLVLVVLADRDAPTGLVRVAMQRALGALT
jgi:predicted regulator of Ras-like GTPase activity (Roadblock/LC7/MglB family)